MRANNFILDCALVGDLRKVYFSLDITWTANEWQPVGSDRYRLVFKGFLCLFRKVGREIRVLKYRVTFKAYLVSHLSLLALSRAYLYQQSQDQTVHRVPLGFQDIAGLRQIGVDTCTLLCFVFRPSKVVILPQDTSVWATLVRRTMCSPYANSCHVLRSI